MKTTPLNIHRGDLVITNENKASYKSVTKVTGDLVIYEDVTVSLKKLQEVSGYIEVRANAKFDAPALTTSGNIYVSENAKLNIRQTQGLEYKSVDNTLFVINKERSSKGIKIYTGYVIQSIHKGKAVVKDCYVAEKDNFYAHGETVKKAIGDLNFKIVSEKLKNEPIEADTIITVNHYRLVTGACELGTKAWMEQNNIQVESIRADELLLLLRKTHAYGLERFERLVNFEAEG